MVEIQHIRERIYQASRSSKGMTVYELDRISEMIGQYGSEQYELGKAENC